MPALLSPPLVDMSQLFLQSGPPDDDDGEGPAALLPRRHINLSIGSETWAFACVRCWQNVQTTETSEIAILFSAELLI